jgi:hypothetical protein
MAQHITQIRVCHPLGVPPVRTSRTGPHLARVTPKTLTARLRGPSTSPLTSESSPIRHDRYGLDSSPFARSVPARNPEFDAIRSSGPLYPLPSSTPLPGRP